MLECLEVYALYGGRLRCDHIGNEMTIMHRVVPVSLESYYCPDTGQHFYTYPNLMRYVNYAKRNKVGAYKLCGKSIRKREDDALKKNASIGRRKTSAALSIRGRPPRPSNSVSLAAAKNDSSKQSSSGESIDKEKDEDYIPE